jgi:hypothetical protein
MPDPELSRAAASSDHQGIWAAVIALVTTGGTLLTAKLRAKSGNAQVVALLREVKADQAEQGKSLAFVRENMATREEVSAIHGKIDRHVEAHAEGKFN